MHVKHGCLWPAASRKAVSGPTLGGQWLAGTINVPPWFPPLFHPFSNDHLFPGAQLCSAYTLKGTPIQGQVPV